MNSKINSTFVQGCSKCMVIHQRLSAPCSASTAASCAATVLIRAVGRFGTVMGVNQFRLN